MADDVLDVLEAGYRLDGDDRQWLDRVARAVQQQLDPHRLGVLAFVYELSSAGKVTHSHHLSYDVPEPFASIGFGIPTALPDWYVRQTFAQHPCGSAVHTGSARARTLARNSMEQAFSGIVPRDLLVVNGLDPTGHGVYVAAARKSARKLSRPLQARWTRVAVHLAAGWRLRRTLRDAAARSIDGAEAVLAPDGRLVHARDQARSRQARQSLMRAARAIEGARTRRGRRQADRAVAEWTGLIAARWSLVDHFESDGKRWLLARRNDVAGVGKAALSPRELQAVAFAALGHNNKLTAYEMGITAETVRVLLHRAARKLGARDRVELITRARLTFTPTT